MWIVERRKERPRPSYNFLAAELSAKLADASQNDRDEFAKPYGTLHPWPERITFETVRQWERIGLHELGEWSPETSPPGAESETQRVEPTTTPSGAPGVDFRPASDPSAGDA